MPHIAVAIVDQPEMKDEAIHQDAAFVVAAWDDLHTPDQRQNMRRPDHSITPFGQCSPIHTMAETD